MSEGIDAAPPVEAFEHRLEDRQVGVDIGDRLDGAWLVAVANRSPL